MLPQVCLCSIIIAYNLQRRSHNGNLFGLDLQRSHSLARMSCTGGVGLAAIQLLTSFGVPPAAVLATAGSATKRSLLRGYGLRHVVSSRSTAFASELLACGGSADVALNTLTSPGLVAATLACLGQGGYMTELSKRYAKDDVKGLRRTFTMTSVHVGSF